MEYDEIEIIINGCITIREEIRSGQIRFLGKRPMGKLFSKNVGDGSQGINRKVCLKFRKSVTIPDKRRHARLSVLTGKTLG